LITFVALAFAVNAGPTVRARGANLIQQVLTGIAFRTERRTVLRRFIFVTWLTILLFGLVGVVADRAFFTHQLCFFVFVQARIAIQTIGGTVLVHVLANTAFYTRFSPSSILMVSFQTFFARFFFGHAFFVGIFSNGTSIATGRTGHTNRGRISATGTICTRFY
jgi:hypothetical protein